MKKLAKFWKELPDQKVRCTLCPLKCVLAPGQMGVCRVRKNEGGKLYTLVYGEATALNPDPIEKKPLYHFWPGSSVFSMSTAGCNLRCRHCQNWTLSQSSVEETRTEQITPERAVELTKRYDCKGIAYTYNEPTIWHEFAFDTAKLAHREGLYNVYVTAGYIELDPLEELRPYLDAMNVDVKSFSDDFYLRISGVRNGVETVTRTCEWAVEHGVHLEITNLIIPGENDKPEEIRELCRWAAEKLGPETPVHFSRFHPMYKMTDRPSTPVETLEQALNIAKDEGLQHVYIGNVPGHEADNTYCPSCGKLLIERHGFTITRYELKDNRCPKCGKKINIVGKHAPSKRTWL
ncbi:MAG: AmmeMemoRadiSam system radical SAM enzyme [Candidatus Hadarchaeota archaeon]|nr:AmmeMemoRadiSam system radical SAM enzyme [Candidatus Hadarchaeota archaeon]